MPERSKGVDLRSIMRFHAWVRTLLQAVTVSFGQVADDHAILRRVEV